MSWGCDVSTNPSSEIRQDLKMPRAGRSRSIMANQSSTWFSHEALVGMKCHAAQILPARRRHAHARASALFAAKGHLLEAARASPIARRAPTLQAGKMRFDSLPCRERGGPGSTEASGKRRAAMGRSQHPAASGKPPRNARFAHFSWSLVGLLRRVAARNR